MRVQRLIMPVTGVESWTLMGDDAGPVDAAERYLANLSAIERSPNTVRAYAQGLRWWFEFLELKQVPWDGVGVEDVSRFVAWLRAPADNVIVLDLSASRRSEATVNRHLAAVFGFYDLARSGGRCNDVSVDLRWGPPAEHLAGPAIHLCGDEADLLQADVVEVGALREVLAQQPVHVLVGGTLPG